MGKKPFVACRHNGVLVCFNGDIGALCVGILGQGNKHLEAVFGVGVAGRIMKACCIYLH